MKKKNTKNEKSEIDNDEIMALSFGVLNLADYLTTRRILNTGGEELNPVANFLIRKNCFGIFKTVSTLAGMAAIYMEEEPKITSKALLSIYAFVVAHNIKEIVQHEMQNDNYRIPFSRD